MRLFGSVGTQSNLLWIGIVLIVAVSSKTAAPEASALPRLWPAPAFSYLDQNRLAVTDQNLKGHVWVSDFFFTTCTTICPTMTAAMAQLQKTIANPNVQFVSFSVDPDHDTPERLREYAAMWKADPSRWHFLSTEKEKLARTAAGMRTFVKPPDNDTPIPHSMLFTLTDRDGMVRGVYDGGDSIALQRLTIDALTLAGTLPKAMPDIQAAWPAPRSSGAADSPGAGLYSRRGCLACHAQGRVAPALEHLLGRPVLLADGHTVTADETYLRESILDPDAKVVAGYPRLMPSYRGRLREDELDQVIEYIKSLDGNGDRLGSRGAPRTALAHRAVDPVCKMAILAGETTPRAVYGGWAYYFCSDSCRERFLKDPARFAGPWDSTDHP